MTVVARQGTGLQGEKEWQWHRKVIGNDLIKMNSLAMLCLERES